MVLNASIPLGPVWYAPPEVRTNHAPRPWQTEPWQADRHEKRCCDALPPQLGASGPKAAVCCVWAGHVDTTSILPVLTSLLLFDLFPFTHSSPPLVAHSPSSSITLSFRLPYSCIILAIAISLPSFPTPNLSSAPPASAQSPLHVEQQVYQAPCPIPHTSNPPTLHC